MSGDVPPLSHMLPYLYLYLYPYKLRNSRDLGPRKKSQEPQSAVAVTGWHSAAVGSAGLRPWLWRRVT